MSRWTPPWRRREAERRRAARDLDDEMRLHVDLEAADLERRGWPPEAARREARVRFGGVERHKESVRAARPGRRLDDLLRDLRHAVRRIRRAPGFAATVVLATAGSLAAFAVVAAFGSSVLLRPYPYPAADRLAYLTAALPEEGVERWRFSGPEMARLEELEGLRVGTFWGGSVNLEGDGLPERIRSLRVTPSFFEVMGVEPVLGRAFDASDRLEDRRLVVIGEGLWARRWGSDPALLGSTLRLSGESYEVVGVMPARFQVIGSEMWTHQPVDFASDPPDREYLYALSRRLRGTTPEEMRATLAGFDPELRASRAGGSGELRPWTMSTVPFTHALDRVRPSVQVLGGAVAVALAVTCLNVWVLMLLRTLARSGDLAVRRVAGATRARLLAGVALEHGLLILPGAAAALAVASWVLGRLHLLVPPRPEGLEYIPFEVRFGLDAPVVGATLLLAAVMLAVSLVPVLRAATGDLAARVRSGRRVAGSSRGRRVLVGGEVALTVVLGVGAGLLLESYVDLRSLDPGFRSEGVTTATLALPSARYPDDEARRVAVREIERALGEMPGVRSAGATSLIPLLGFEDEEDVLLDIDGGRPRIRATRRATPGFFATLGIPVVRGRGFADADRPGAEPVAVVNETMARLLAPGGDPLGRTVRVTAEDAPRTVVGVVGDVRDIDLERPVPPTVYVPMAQRSPAPGLVSLLVHAPDVGAGMGQRIREEVARLDPLLPVWETRTMDSWIQAATGTHRLALVLLGAFSVLTLGLTALGIYAVVGFDVRSQLREFGIRSALGADRARLGRLVLGRTAAVLLPAIAVGLVLAATAALFLRARVSAVASAGSAPYVTGALVIVLAGALAALPPTLRVVRLAPSRVLQAE